MADYEKLGAFYFGKQWDMDQGELTDDLVLYDSKDLCTHGVCVGMTGSGKTGLCIGLLEEAAIDGIPAICIDPKGDLGNLMLTFPKLRASDFEPWVDPSEATRKGVTTSEYAKDTAALWKKGLKEWDQGQDRIKRLREAADVVIYTPASDAGIPITVLRSFNAPPEEVRDDSEPLRERIMSAVSGLLALMQIEADPISSRDHILLSNILDHAWRQGKDVDMGTLIRSIQSPDFDKVGFMDLETFYPEKDRFKLSMQLNNLLASPSFQAWLEGEPLDIQKLYYTADGKPKISIISIAHLSDAERMFFVTILLNEVLAWMRSQPGTSSLRSLLYMDEVFGYFPPTRNPPSKQPMLTLLKQARAFGLGCVLATQNPVDLDYKGLSNCGTWFLGRLQTERDKARVMEGLEGASAQAGASFDKQRMERILAGLGSRVFLMNNVHEDEPIVFHTRWVLSYLRGPMTKRQIEDLMDPIRDQHMAAVVDRKQKLGRKAKQKRERPVIPPGIEEVFLPSLREPDEGERLIYRPALLGSAKLHYSRSTYKVDMFKELSVLLPVEDGVAEDTWEDGEFLEIDDVDLDKKAEKGADFAQLPAELTQKKNYTSWKTDLKDHLYRNHPLEMWSCKTLKMYSQPGESEGDFRIRMKHESHELRDIAMEKLRKRYAPKLASAQERVRKAEQRVEREKAQQKEQSLSAAISFGTSVLGALFGRKLGSRTNVSRVGTTIRAAGRAAREKADIEQARDTVETYAMRLHELEDEFQQEIEELGDKYDPILMELENVSLRAKKTTLKVQRVALVWTPWIVDEDGIADPTFAWGE